MTARLPFVAADEAPPLADVLAELRALRADVRRLLERDRRPRLPVRDREALERLLPAAHDACGTSLWTSADLAALATLPGRDALAAALAPLITRAGGLRGLGKLLSRAAGIDVAGLTVRSLGREGGATVWRVEVSNPRETPETFPAD